MIFADLDANGYAIVIAAIFLGAGQLVSMVLAYYREKDKIQRDEDVAKKASKAAEAAGLAASAAETAVDRADTHAQRIEHKIDANTKITAETKEAAESVNAHTENCTTAMGRLAATDDDHHRRILALETQMDSLKAAVEVVSKNIDSTRHEMRGYFQTLGNKLDIMLATSKPPAKTE